MKPFTIIMPVYNEEEILKANVQRLITYNLALSTSFEVIAVSNGSTDDSDKIGRELQKQFSQFKFIGLPERGVGRAFKRGILEAKYDDIIFMDADLSADLIFINEASRLLADHVLVLGAKIGGLQNRSLFRRVGSFVFYLSVLALTGLRYTDYAPGAKAYRKSFLQKYFDCIDDFTSFVLNLTFIASVKKEPVAEVAIACDDRRRSRFNLWREAASKYRGLGSLKLRQVTGRL
jgi:glycosyltransferase involved in cell wall biosynthesis